MLKVVTGRIICVLTILLMVTGFTFSMQKIEIKKIASLEIKQQTTYNASNQVLESLNYSEIEEVEDLEDFDDVVTLLDTFVFYGSSDSVENILELNHSKKSKTIAICYQFKQEFILPKWIYLRKIIL